MQLLSILASFLSLASALTINTRSPQGHTVHQFPNGTWVENIAVRSTGDLLVTIVTSPDLYLISPSTSSQNPTSPQTAALIHNFAPFAAVLGITYTQPDQFYVIAGNLSLSPLNAGLGSYTIFSINLSTYNAHSNTGAVIQEFAPIPSAGILNGMSTLSATQGLLVLADSILGAIWLLNTKTGTSSILLQEPEMQPPPGATLGINGKTGPVETLVTGYAIDDFALDEKTGMAYLAGGAVDQVLQVGLKGGEVSVVYGGNVTLGPPTSVAVGRAGEEGWLFVTTQKGKVVGVEGVC